MCRTQKEFTDWNRGNKGGKAQNEVWETGRSLIIWVVMSVLFNLSAHGLLGYKLLATCLWQEKELSRCKSTISPKTLLVEPIYTYAHTQTHIQLARLSQWEKVCAALQLCSEGNSFQYVKNMYLVVRDLEGMVIVWSKSLFKIISVIIDREWKERDGRRDLSKPVSREKMTVAWTRMVAMEVED